VACHHVPFSSLGIPDGGGGLDDGLGAFLDWLVGAKDSLPNHCAENAAEQGADPENPDSNNAFRCDTNNAVQW